MFNKKNNNRRPVAKQLLRHAGQSLDDEIQKNKDKFIAKCSTLIYLFGGNIVGWMVYFINSSTALLLLILVSSGAILYLFYTIQQWFRLQKHNKNLKLGRDGEKEVAENLDTLKKEGVHIFHDIINEEKTFNIDHVIICSKGVFIVETKTYSKPSSKKATISYQNNELIINGKNNGNKIIRQAKSQVKWLEDKLRITDVQAIVVFPGWWVEAKSKGKTISVINPKNLKAFINASQDKLTLSESNLISTTLYNHVRMSSY